MECEMNSLDDLRASAHELGPELAVATGFKCAGYEIGLISFRPGEASDARQIVHDDLDVICLVLSGQGRLTCGARTTQLSAGTLCRIPARTPHDFAAVDTSLELLYATVKVTPERAAAP